MSEPGTPNWLNWVLPAVAVLGVLWAMVKKLFTNAVRAEMEEMHEQNQERLKELEERLGNIEKALSRIAGRMQERWGNGE